MPLSFIQSGILPGGRVVWVRCSRAVSPVSMQPTRRRIHQISKKELRSLLPTIDELGLRKGDKVTVAMSGGVDSSVTLRILADMPLNLDVVFMRNWDSELSESPDTSPGAGPSTHPFSLAYFPDGKGKGKSACSWEKDWSDVRAVASHVGIPPERVRMLDFTKEYWSRVFEPAIAVWQAGGTPNPDVDCNREIKFGALLEACVAPPPAWDPRHRNPPRPTHFLATGHYARKSIKPHITKLCRAADRNKDQTYYLSGMSHEQLRQSVFPLANIKKGWVRRLAEFNGLPTAEREESMGVCFIGERARFGDFIAQYTTRPDSPGRLVTPNGDVVGEHEGLWYYTIGQRARVAGMEERWFVAKKGVGDKGQDILIVPSADHPLLQCTSVIVPSPNWINAPPKGLAKGSDHVASCAVQIRHRMAPVKANVRLRKDGSLECQFKEPITGVAEGQSLGLWFADWCLGGGVIGETRLLGDETQPRRRLGREHDGLAEKLEKIRASFEEPPRLAELQAKGEPAKDAATA